MAKSKYEYVKGFESHPPLLPGSFIVVRIDGKCFTEFTTLHSFSKPNDPGALKLMNLAAQTVLRRFPDVVMAYGQSDEYSFLLRRDSDLFSRRSDKIATTIVSCFTSAYCFNFEKLLGKELADLPIFDGRCVVYPSFEHIRDYFAWRQADCHINNLYNTGFWLLVKKGETVQKAQKIMGSMNSKEKKEFMIKELGVDYEKEDAQFRKGTTLVKEFLEEKSKKKPKKAKKEEKIVEGSFNVIEKEFWTEYFSQERSEETGMGQTKGNLKSDNPLEVI